MDDKDIHEAKLQVQGQLAAQYIQEVMQKITDKCFERCVTRPGAKLDDSEKLCTAKCMDRYLDSMTLVSQAWAARAKAQAAAGGGSSGLM
ncbi:mitochondrial import inner membrane translocase subunit tim13 [Chrysochromulina tobinii]|uniref:Mitochondrial import inner membrane translocase subunit n=1 Tax=Chrysochromulina tobinii TaxID=1460289 RepID=A0A0M0LQB2_9EUKA|nr:mitochondrial import inner membrane translocase subunit tim13 [Chrysochromulina tobinii]|eukprot:KOO52918.1 mitochondrial import inner membrane translocase subunit tim13 [Chrysochromulina sp. CCMP291]